MPAPSHDHHSENPVPSLSEQEALETILKLQHEIDEVDKENETLHAATAIAKNRIKKITALRHQAQLFEYNNNMPEAISTYLLSIHEAETDPTLNPKFFASDINKVIALYDKTGQAEMLKSFLEEKIKLYPACIDTKGWSLRLSEIQNA